VVKYAHLPKLLVLHLKRFHFSPSALRWEKITDKVEFPLVLNMNRYIDSGRGPGDVASELLAGAGSRTADMISFFDTIDKAALP
jgi:hypothetical protein